MQAVPEIAALDDGPKGVQSFGPCERIGRSGPQVYTMGVSHQRSTRKPPGRIARHHGAGLKIETCKLHGSPVCVWFCIVALPDAHEPGSAWIAQGGGGARDHLE
jgi:hypothetical protein